MIISTIARDMRGEAYLRLRCCFQSNQGVPTTAEVFLFASGAIAGGVPFSLIAVAYFNGELVEEGYQSQGPLSTQSFGPRLELCDDSCRMFFLRFWLAVSLFTTVQ